MDEEDIGKVRRFYDWQSRCMIIAFVLIVTAVAAMLWP